MTGFFPGVAFLLRLHNVDYQMARRPVVGFLFLTDFEECVDGFEKGLLDQRVTCYIAVKGYFVMKDYYTFTVWLYLYYVNGPIPCHFNDNDFLENIYNFLDASK